MNYDDYRKEKSDKGNKFEDYVYPILCKEWGVKFTPYKTKYQQYNVGENSFGIEIKFDEKSINSPNLYIETEEKSDPSLLSFSKSGIYRKDNSWLYLIGNYDIFYIFLKKRLKDLHNSNKYDEVETKTSQGFLIPQAEAVNLALDVINISRDQDIFDPLEKHDWMNLDEIHSSN